MTTPLQSAAYVDTTALTPLVADEEPVAASIRRKLESFRYLLSANLLGAEMRVVFALEGRAFDDDVLSSVRWIMPNRRLDAEMAAVFANCAAATRSAMASCNRAVLCRTGARPGFLNAGRAAGNRRAGFGLGDCVTSQVMVLGRSGPSPI